MHYVGIVASEKAPEFESRSLRMKFEEFKIDMKFLYKIGNELLEGNVVRINENETVFAGFTNGSFATIRDFSKTFPYQILYAKKLLLKNW